MWTAISQAFGLLFSGDTGTWEIVFTSLSVSASALLLSLVPGLSIAFVLARVDFPGRRAVLTLFDTLLAVPAVVIGLVVFLCLSRNGPFGDLRWLFTQRAMVIGQICMCFPILVSLGTAAIQEADPRAWETARTLGASKWRAALTLMGEVRFGVLAAVVAAFGRIVAEVGSALMVGGNILHHTRNITTAIALETSKGEFAEGIALGVVLLALALALNFLLSLLRGRGRLAT